MLILLYFLLAGGDLFLQKLIKVLPHFSDKMKAVEIARATEAAVSAYSHRAVVNVGQGIVVASCSAARHAERAAVGHRSRRWRSSSRTSGPRRCWPARRGRPGDVPDVGHALLVPGAFLAINLLQANFVTPVVLGHRLTLNPVAIFVGLVFWCWIWGVPGAFLAVPLLATFKIFCDHIESLAPIGEFLGKVTERDVDRLTAEECARLGSLTARVDCGRVRLHRSPRAPARSCSGSAAAARWRWATMFSCRTAAPTTWPRWRTS